jgi:hypothetical protein
VSAGNIAHNAANAEYFPPELPQMAASNAG